MKDFAKGRRGSVRSTKCNQKTMWILPNQLKSLTSACAPDTEASTLDLRELSATCARSLTVRGKQPPSNSFSRAWKAGNLMRLQSGLICDPSRGQSFLTEWTSSLVATPASPSQAQASDSEPKTSGTSGQPSQMAFGFCDQESASSRTSRDTSPLGCEKSLQSWKDSVTARRGEYSARLKLAHRTNASGCSSWPTASTRDWKDTPGMAKESTDKDGSHRNRTDQLARAVYAYGQAAPANRSSGGSRQELWPTPDATNANDGVPWEKFHASMMERRAQVKKAVAEGKTKQGSGRSPNLAASVQNPQWATPSTGKLNPRWVETLMGLPVGWTMVSCSHPIVFNASAATTLSAGNVEVTTRTVHAQDQTAVMTDNRTDELRMLGNGVVPATAARAFVTLMEELL